MFGLKLNKCVSTFPPLKVVVKIQIQVDKISISQYITFPVVVKKQIQ